MKALTLIAGRPVVLKRRSCKRLLIMLKMTFRCLRRVVSAKNKRRPTWGSGSHSWLNFLSLMCALVVAASTTNLTSMPGSMTIRVSEGGPERKFYGP